MRWRRRKALPRSWLWLVRLIGVIVPRRLRADWRQEWEAELRYRETLLSQWDKLDRRNKRDLLWHSLGAFMDALWLQLRRLEDEMFQDLRFGVRMLLKNPGFTLIAIFTLALGIGANTTIFSLVDALILRPFDFPHQERLVMVWEQDPQSGDTRGSVAPGNFNDWREHSKNFEQLVALEQRTFDLTGEHEPERFNGYGVSPGFLDALGVDVALGRAFHPSEYEPGRDQVVVLKHSLWQRRFDSDPNIVGRTLSLNAKTFTVIGVLRADLNFPVNGSDMLSPLAFDDQAKQERGNHSLQALGLLKPGVSIAQAGAELDAISRRAQRLFPETNARRTSEVVGMNEDFARKAQMYVPLLMGMVGFVLLIACANVANMLLSRALSRGPEIAVRLALGASRPRVIRQMLTESLLLALAGGILGLLLSVWAVNQLHGNLPEDYAKFIPGWDHLSLNRAALLFTLLVSMLTAALFGLMPAWQASKPNLNEALKEGGKTTSPSGMRRRLRDALVVTEVALSLVLLIGAGLMIRSFVATVRDDIGINPHNTLSFQIELFRDRYSEEKCRSFYDQLIKRLQTLPGVVAAGAINSLPLSDESFNTSFEIVGRLQSETGKGLGVNYRVLTPGYISAIGMRLRRGRDFTMQDNEQSPRVVIINETFARRFFPDQGVIGQRITAFDQAAKPLEIVGVVGDVKNDFLGEHTSPCIYLACAQYPSPRMGIVMRTAAEPTLIAAAARNEVMNLDPSQPVINLKTVERVVREQTSPTRLMTALMGVFAVIALALAAVGIYAVIAFAVSQRTHEIGVRLALGAQPRNILRLITGHGLILIGAGLALGMAGAFALTRVMSPILYGISAVDPPTFILISLLLLSVALLACYLPARRATKVDPMIALRHE